MLIHTYLDAVYLTLQGVNLKLHFITYDIS